MKKELKVFFERLVSDPQFRQIFVTTSSAEEGYERAKPYLDDVTFEEFKKGIYFVHEKFFNKTYKELDGQDLTEVSGGKQDMFVNMVGELENGATIRLMDSFKL